MDLCGFVNKVCKEWFPAYTPQTLGETYLDIIMPLIEWQIITKGGTVAPSNGDLVIGGKVFKKVTADQVNWL